MRLPICRQLVFWAGVLIGFWPVSLRAQNKFDVLVKTLQPYTALFFNKSAERGLQADFTVRQDSSNNRLLLDRPTRVFFQPPDKLRVEITGFEPKVVLCRNGQNIWVSPKSFGEQLLAGLSGAGSGQPAPDFRLPWKETELMLLPALLQIYSFAPGQDQQNQPIWLIRLRPDPQLTHNKITADWNAGVTVRQKDNLLERIDVSSQRWSGAVDVSNPMFVASFPDATWTMDSAQANDSVQIPASAYTEILQRIAGVRLTR